MEKMTIIPKIAMAMRRALCFIELGDILAHLCTLDNQEKSCKVDSPGIFRPIPLGGEMFWKKFVVSAAVALVAGCNSAEFLSQPDKGSVGFSPEINWWLEKLPGKYDVVVPEDCPSPYGCATDLAVGVSATETENQPVIHWKGAVLELETASIAEITWRQIHHLSWQAYLVCHWENDRPVIESWQIDTVYGDETFMRFYTKL